MHCPHCLRRNDAHTPLTEGQRPADGSVSICAYCFTPAIFVVDTETSLIYARLPTVEEQRDLDRDADVQDAIALAKRLNHLLGRD